MSEWYYSAVGYALFALSAYHIDTVEPARVYRDWAIVALVGMAAIHLIHAATKRTLSRWILAAAYLLYGASYGAFLYRQYVR